MTCTAPSSIKRFAFGNLSCRPSLILHLALGHSDMPVLGGNATSNAL